MVDDVDIPQEHFDYREVLNNARNHSTFQSLLSPFLIILYMFALFVATILFPYKVLPLTFVQSYSFFIVIKFLSYRQ